MIDWGLVESFLWTPRRLGNLTDTFLEGPRSSVGDDSLPIIWFFDFAVFDKSASLANSSSSVSVIILSHRTQGKNATLSFGLISQACRRRKSFLMRNCWRKFPAISSVRKKWGKLQLREIFSRWRHLVSASTAHSLPWHDIIIIISMIDVKKTNTTRRRITEFDFTLLWCPQ